MGKRTQAGWPENAATFVSFDLIYDYLSISWQLILDTHVLVSLCRRHGLSKMNTSTVLDLFAVADVNSMLIVNACGQYKLQISNASQHAVTALTFTQVA